MANKGKPEPNYSGREQYERHIDGNITVRGQIETHLPPDAAKEDEADRKHQKTHRNKNFVVSLLTLIFVIIYAGVAAWQGYLSHKQGKIIAAQFELTQAQQRAYVQITANSLSQFKLDQPKPLSLGIEIQNIGKSTAARIHGTFVVELPLSGQQPSFSIDKGGTNFTNAPLFPGSPPYPLGPLWVAGYGMAPSLPPSVIDELKNGQRYVTVFGRVEYEDTFGKWWTQFCGWRTLATTPGFFQISAGNCIDFNTDGGTPKK